MSKLLSEQEKIYFNRYNVNEIGIKYDSETTKILVEEVVKEMNKYVKQLENQESILDISDEEILNIFDYLKIKIENTLKFHKDGITPRKESGIGRALSTFFTCLLKRSIQSGQIKQEYYKKIIQPIHRKLLDTYTDFRKKSKEEYYKKVEIRKNIDCLISVDIQKYIKTSYDILSNCEKNDWRDISMALALVTGKRLSEIHETGIFNNIDRTLEGRDFLKEYQMSFKGQLKTNVENRVKEYYIFTLIPSDIVLKAFDYLVSIGRKKQIDKYKNIQLKDGYKPFNPLQYYAKMISEHVNKKTIVSKLNFISDTKALEDIEELKKQGIDTKFEYRLFRSMNARCISQAFSKFKYNKGRVFDSADVESLVGNQLGDSLQTLVSYKRFYLEPETRVFYNGSEFI